MKYRIIVHIALVRLLCPSTEKKDKILSAHNQIDAGNLLSNVLNLTWNESHSQPTLDKIEVPRKLLGCPQRFLELLVNNPEPFASHAWYLHNLDQMVWRAWSVFNGT